jgi:hypothetical protein
MLTSAPYGRRLFLLPFFWRVGRFFVASSFFKRKNFAINPIAVLFNVALRALQDDLRGFANPIHS